MVFHICEKRRAVIDSEGHALVLGGPGAGKTTLALLRSQALMAALKPGQKVLFLSFSRAAVQQIVARCRDVLNTIERSQIDVRTYHGFCWDILSSHGRAFKGRPLTMMTPGVEGKTRTRFEGDWAAERQRLFEDESVVCFDQFAHCAARLIEESQHLRGWIGQLYPLIILDEFQDTDDDQWRLVNGLRHHATAIFLADPEQRIFDFRPGVRPERLRILREAIQLFETDLEADNHRSPASGIVDFANAVLRRVAALPRTPDVRMFTYRPFPNIFASTVHFQISQTFAS